MCLISLMQNGKKTIYSKCNNSVTINMKTIYDKCNEICPLDIDKFVEEIK